MFFGGQYRWIHERWTPYVGFGVGFAFPHVEVRRAGPASPIPSTIRSTASPSKAWSASNTISAQRFSVFGDYKLSFSSNDADLKGGGSLETDVWTNHVIFGVVLPLRRRAPAPDAPTSRYKSGGKRFTNPGPMTI